LFGILAKTGNSLLQKTFLRVNEYKLR